MPNKQIIKLHQSSARFDTELLSNQCCYSDESLGLSIGIVDSHSLPKAVIPDGYDELIVVIKGTLQVENNLTGTIDTFQAGESVVIHQEGNNQYHQSARFRAIYVTYQCTDNIDKLQQFASNIVPIHEHSDMSWQKTSDGHRKKVLYQHSNQGFTVGVWQSKALTTGLINFPYHEFILINQGELICIDETGIEHRFSAGDALFIPQGTSCAWQINDGISIHFAQIR